MSASETSAPAWSGREGFYREARLDAAGIPHGVTMRAAGNMKESELRARVLAAAGLGSRRARLLRQVHGTHIHEALAEEQTPEGDGWVCAERSVVAAVYVADCLPIFIWGRRLEAVGVFHAGWRGLAAGMPRAAVRAFRRYGLTPEKLAATVGPHVGACCYQVGPDVAGRFSAEVQVPSGGGAKLDLGLSARLQMVESGIAADAVTVSDACTSCRTDEFFSYRREKMDRRMMAFVALP